MSAAPRRTLALLAVATASGAFAGEEAGSGRRAAPATKPSWEFAATAYPTFVRDGDDYTSGIVAADRGPLHLEGRISYEAHGARSAFVGWTFSGGDAITWEVTPLAGGAWGSIHAFVPAIELSVASGRFDLYVEGEYVRHTNERDSSYFYAWSELGFRPLEWLRAGLVAQRTRAHGGERDVQRGPFVQASWRRITLGGFWFNPGSSDQVFVLSIGASF
jgi:hypothetical protein